MLGNAGAAMQAIWDWLNWNAIAAIGQVAGAIATLAAVVVALLQARALARPHVQLALREDWFKDPPDGSGRKDPAMRLSATNIGSRPVRLTIWGAVWLSSGDDVDIDTYRATPLPVTLQDAEHATVHIKHVILNETAWQRRSEGKRRIRCYFVDTAGRRYGITWRITSDKWVSPVPARTPALAPVVATRAPAAQARNCHPSHPALYLPASPGLDRLDNPAKNFPVRPPDPHQLDADNDDTGCEGR
jgi:hypothetical protein